MNDWSEVIAEILATVILYSIVSYLFIWAISGLFGLKWGINEFPYILVLFFGYPCCR